MPLTFTCVSSEVPETSRLPFRSAGPATVIAVPTFTLLTSKPLCVRL